MKPSTSFPNDCIYANKLTKPVILLTSPQMPDLEKMAPAQPPRVWVLTTEKLGDNAQVLAIANALGWPYELKHLEFTNANHVHSRASGPSLWKLAVDRSSPLVPPWPDLLLTIGRRSSPVALGIRQWSGDRTRLVQVGQGESRVGFACFDLVIGNPQCYLPTRPNLVRLELPLLYGNSATTSAAVAQWQPRFMSLPRPWTALLVGGSARSFDLGCGGGPAHDRRDQSACDARRWQPPSHDQPSHVSRGR